MTNQFIMLILSINQKNRMDGLDPVSVVNYTTDYFIASMPEIGLSGRILIRFLSIPNCCCISKSIIPNPLCLM